MAMSTEVSERLLGAVADLALELGSLLREGFLDHIRFMRLVNALPILLMYLNPKWIRQQPV